MPIAVEDVDGTVTKVVLSGRIDIAGAHEIDMPMNVVAGSKRAVVIDLSKVEFLASMGLRSIVVCAKSIVSKRGKVVLFAPQPQVEEVITDQRHRYVDRDLPGRGRGDCGGQTHAGLIPIMSDAGDEAAVRVSALQSKISAAFTRGSTAQRRRARCRGDAAEDACRTRGSGDERRHARLSRAPPARSRSGAQPHRMRRRWWSRMPARPSIRPPRPSRPVPPSLEETRARRTGPVLAASFLPRYRLRTHRQPNRLTLRFPLPPQ